MGIYNGDRGPSYIPLIEGEVVELVIQNARLLNGGVDMHTWHLHEHSFYVVGLGFGTFDEETDPELYNLENPVMHDTVPVLPLGWTAIRVRICCVISQSIRLIFTTDSMPVFSLLLATY